MMIPISFSERKNKMIVYIVESTKTVFLLNHRIARTCKCNKDKNLPKELTSANKDLTHFPFLQALADREELVRNGRLTTIIFLREQKPGTKKEISGYIDYAHRLKTENFEIYFEREVV